MTTDQSPAQEAAQPATPEVVHFISNFYDFPLEGLADFGGAPHVFFLVDEIHHPVDGDPDDVMTETVYALYPASPQLEADMREKHAIFERWHQAYSQKLVTIQDHPALLEDRPRHAELQARVGGELKALRAAPPALVRSGKMRGGRRAVEPGKSRWGGFDVEWVR